MKGELVFEGANIFGDKLKKKNMLVKFIIELTIVFAIISLGIIGISIFIYRRN